MTSPDQHGDEGCLRVLLSLAILALAIMSGAIVAMFLQGPR